MGLRKLVKGRREGEENWRRGEKIGGKRRKCCFLWDWGLQRHWNMVFLWTIWCGGGTGKEPGLCLIRGLDVSRVYKVLAILWAWIDPCYSVEVPINPSAEAGYMNQG